MRLALLGLIGMSFVAGVSAQTSFCDTYFPPVVVEGSVQSSQADQLTSFLTTVATGGTPDIPSCTTPPERRLLAVGSCEEVEGLFDKTTLQPFFNGSNPAFRNPADNTPTAGNDLPDFINVGANGEALLNRLVAFFGQEGALNCSMDADFPAYEGRANQNDVHKNMPITEEAFNAFVQSVVDTGLSYGLTADQLAPAGALLNSFKRHSASPDTNAATICNQDDCECAPEAEGGADCKATGGSSSSTGDDGGAASTVSVSFFAMAVAAVAALVRA